VQKELLLEMIVQNQITCWAAFNNVTPENVDFRLNSNTASAGFIYRHVGETMNLFGLFFGLPVQVQNSTMGKTDEGQGHNLEESHQLIEQGYQMLQAYVESQPDSAWLETIETPFFGTVSRMRLFSHILYHNSYHAGQIGLTLKRGSH
jgi:uncharacterized damage-inducible protein DinB